MMLPTESPVLVSKTLADANNLKVGSTFKLANISDSKKTYTFTVAGIYSEHAGIEHADGRPHGVERE